MRARCIPSFRPPHKVWLLIASENDNGDDDDDDEVPIGASPARPVASRDRSVMAATGAAAAAAAVVMVVVVSWCPSPASHATRSTHLRRRRLPHPSRSPTCRYDGSALPCGSRSATGPALG